MAPLANRTRHPLDIRTVRPVTDAELELGQWHDDMVAREAANKNK